MRLIRHDHFEQQPRHRRPAMRGRCAVVSSNANANVLMPGMFVR